MAFCANCGAEVQGRFCAKCGAPAPAAGASARSRPAPSSTSRRVPLPRRRRSSPRRPSRRPGRKPGLRPLLCPGTPHRNPVPGPGPLQPKPPDPLPRLPVDFPEHSLDRRIYRLSIVSHRIVAHPLPGRHSECDSASGCRPGRSSLLWLMLMYKAYNRERWVLPFIGPLAEKQA